MADEIKCAECGIDARELMEDKEMEDALCICLTGFCLDCCSDETLGKLKINLRLQ